MGETDHTQWKKFAADESLDTLESNTVWHADGRFKACPALFYHPFTIHDMVNNQTVSLVFFLLQNKSKEQYIRAFRQLSEMIPGFEPSQIVVDFEKASINAFQILFNGVTMKGCFFISLKNFQFSPKFKRWD